MGAGVWSSTIGFCGHLQVVVQLLLSPGVQLFLHTWKCSRKCVNEHKKDKSIKEASRHYPGSQSWEVVDNACLEEWREEKEKEDKYILLCLVNCVVLVGYQEGVSHKGKKKRKREVCSVIEYICLMKYYLLSALKGVESATDELNEELHRLTVNMKKLTEYQSLLLRVNSQLDNHAIKKQQTKADTEHFDQLFVQIVNDLTEQDLNHPEVGDAIRRLKQVLEYNAPGGKRNRGLSVIASYRELVTPEQLTPENLQRALVVGWCIELDGIGLDAVNDSFLLEATIYRLLKKYCRGEPFYINLIELFLETSYQTELGQALDLITAPPNQIDLTRFTDDRYKAIVKYKTAFYSFYLPVAAAMYMAGIDDEMEHNNAKAILLEMGEFFQIQDDYLDCFGDPAITGKIGTDIEDNKCSWLVVEALKRVTSEQRQVLELCYGRKDSESVNRVKSLYADLKMPKVYSEYEDSSYQRLMGLIERHANKLPHSIFLSFAQKIYKRNK
ncbi:FPPS synthase, partial [Polypterus senegalus]